MNVLITGGTGSFGRAFIRHCQLSRPEVERVISLSRDEVKADDLWAEFSDYPNFRAYLGDIRDYQRLCQALRGTDVVVHAAALKRVNAHTDGGELVKTNIIGTMNVVNACLACGVRKLVFLSSDKAVEPMNQYGKTKAAAEGFVVASNAYHPKVFRASVVRYGNVLGSRGSVLSLWREAIERGDPLVLTDPEMTRFWMSLAGAVRLVWKAVDLMIGGEIFIPSLRSSHVSSLMSVVAAQCGKEPDHTVAGIRAGGEKVHEKLISTEEVSRTLFNATKNIYVITPSDPSWTGEPWASGSQVDSGFQYVSNDPSRIMPQEDVADLVVGNQ